jgi:RNA polymerase sigma-70 factor (ECF subfamily)
MDDPRALYEALVTNHARDLYRVACRLSGNATTAEDLVQETFVQAWRSIHSLRDPHAGRVWLLQILRHCWYRQQRTSSRRPLENVLDMDVVSPEPPTDVHTASHDYVQRALDELSPAYREPFVLVVMEGFRCREVADMLELPLGTVLSRLHRAREVLKRHIEEEARRRAQSRSSDKVRKLRNA